MAVGDLGRTAMADVARLAGEHEIRVAVCEDSYSAVAELAGRAGRSSLVIGHLAELARENSVFFSIAARNGARCCCLRKAERPSDSEDAVAAIQAGARLISGNGDLVTAVENWLAEDGDHAGAAVESHWTRRDEDFRTTQAELSALLGPGMDD